MSLPADNHLDSGKATPLSRFLAYDFASDDEYQKGMTGISTSGVLEGKTDEEKADIQLRSEIFYFNRLAGSSVTVEEVLLARAGQTASLPSQISTEASSSSEEEPKTLTFAQLKALIEQGHAIDVPNNKVIPTVLSSEAPSESKAEVRKKPWESNPAA